MPFSLPCSLASSLVLGSHSASSRLATIRAAGLREGASPFGATLAVVPVGPTGPTGPTGDASGEPSGLPSILMGLGILILGITIIRAVRGRLRAGHRKLPPPEERRERLAEHVARAPWRDRRDPTEAEISALEASQRLVVALDAKGRRLERLLVEADERIAKLRASAADARPGQVGVNAGSSPASVEVPRSGPAAGARSSGGGSASRSANGSGSEKGNGDRTGTGTGTRTRTGTGTGSANASSNSRAHAGPAPSSASHHRPGSASSPAPVDGRARSADPSDLSDDPPHPEVQIPSGPRKSAAPGRRSAETADDLARQVHAMADAGHDPVQIARSLDEHVGKVELILALREPPLTPGDAR